MDNSTQQLRQQILSLAVSGKLVPQDETEGTARDMLKQIETEKAKLIKEGKIKKNKPLPPVSDEEKPFEIPESWEWVRLSSISSSILYGVSESAKTKGKYKLLRITDIQNNTVNWETVPYTDFDENKVTNYILEKNDILFARTGGTVGKSYLVNECPSNSIYASYLIRVRINDEIYAKYVKFFFESPLYWNQVIDKASGSGQPNCNGEKLTNLVLPLPPLAEQKRIVAKLEVLMKELDTIEQTKEQIEHYAEQLQGQILQTAIQGKLVPQIASEGNAQDLLHKIEAERKKSNPKYKPLPPVTDEEKPFEIPESWVWCRIGDLFSHSAGKQLSGKGGDGKPYKYITTSNLYWGRFELEHLKEMNFTDAELERCSAHKGDLLVCEGGDIGRSAIWNYDYDIRLQNHVHRLRPILEEFCVKFFYFIMYFYKNTSVIGGKGIGIQGLSANTLKNISVPLPPLSEQKRIVAKLEELLGEVEKLKR